MNFPIPKIIHLTYKSRDQILDEWKDVIPAWQKTNSDWEIKFWSDQDNLDLVATTFPWFLDTYNKLEYNIQRADAVRCCYLYKYGGVYVDMDYMPQSSINDLFEGTNNGIYLTTTLDGYCYINSFMASKPGEVFWIDYLRAIQNTKPKLYWTKHLYVFYTTGPFQLNSVVKKSSKTIGVINPRLIHPCSICNIEQDDVCTSIYLKRIKGQSWNSIDTTILNFMYCNTKITVLLLLLIILSLFYLVIRK